MSQKQCVAQSNASAVSSFTISFTATAAADNLLLMFFLDVLTTPTSVVDSSSAALVSRLDGDVTSDGIFVYDRLSCSAGVNSVTVTLPSASQYAAAILTRNDLLSFDQVQHAQPGTVTSWSSSPLPPLNFSDEYLLGLACSFNMNTNSYTVGAGFSAIAGTGLTGGAIVDGSGNAMFFENKILSSATGTTPVADGGCASTYQYCAGIAYRLAGAPIAPTDSTVLLLL